MGWRIAYLVAACGIYLADQATKAWAVSSLPQPKTLINGFLRVRYATNDGVAFSQFQGGGSFVRWFFVVLAALAAVAVLIYFFRTARNDDRILGACALLLAGIAGNLTDRARLGHVIDFIELHYYESFSWPVFNVADMSICAGAFLLIYDMFRKGRSQKAEGRSQEKKTHESVISTQESK